MDPKRRSTNFKKPQSLGIRMKNDPHQFFQPYFEPTTTPAQEPASRAAATPGDFSIDALVSNRRQILEVKMAVLLAASAKRFAIRKAILESLQEDELSLRNLALTSPGAPTVPPSPIDQGLLAIEQQRRDEEASCWRDIIPIMRDVLTTWEALEQTRARAVFLSSYPSWPASNERGEQE